MFMRDSHEECTRTLSDSLGIFATVLQSSVVCGSVGIEELRAYGVEG